MRKSVRRQRGLALPGKRDGIHGLLELAIFGPAQKTSDIQKDDEAHIELADSRDLFGFAVAKNGARGFDFGRRNLEYFRGGTDNQAEELVIQLDDENAILFVGLGRGSAESFAQIHHGDYFSAKVYDALDQVGRAWDGGDFRHADDFPDGTDANAIGFAADSKADDLEFFLHECFSALGPCQFGVFEFAGFAGCRGTPFGRRILAGARMRGAIDDETIHGVEQVAGKFKHLFGGGGKLGGAGSRLLNQFAHLVYGADDVLRAGSLFLDGGADLLSNLREAVGGLGDLRGADGLFVGRGADLL